MGQTCRESGSRTQCLYSSRVAVNVASAELVEKVSPCYTTRRRVAHQRRRRYSFEQAWQLGDDTAHGGIRPHRRLQLSIARRADMAASKPPPTSPYHQAESRAARSEATDASRITNTIPRSQTNLANIKRELQAQLKPSNPRDSSVALGQQYKTIRKASQSPDWRSWILIGAL